jgi:hypothetical protein
MILGFKLLNTGGVTASFWLTVSTGAASEWIPLYGEVVPKPLRIGESQAAALDAGENAYYVISLSKGDYKVVLDFANSKRDNTNLQGYLAFLDADGGNQRKATTFNDINVSYRKAATLSLKKDETVVLRIHNENARVDYKVQITPTT